MKGTTLKDNTDISAFEQVFIKMTESTKSMFDLTIRVDERVKMLVDKHTEIDRKFNQLMEVHNQLLERIVNLESKNVGDLRLELKRLEDALTQLDFRMGTHEKDKNDLWGSVKYFGGWIVHALWVIIVCYLLYKLGINTPPVP